MTTTKTPAEILNGAADLIEDSGLGKGEYFNRHSGCYCTMGALVAQAGWDGQSIPGFQLLQDVWAAAEAISAKLGDSDIVGWNDADERTTEEVVTALREAAELAAAA